MEEMMMKWQEWWTRNEYRFIRVEKKAITKSGSEVVMDDLSPEMKELVTFLLKQMKHDYWDVRAASALALGKIGLKNEEIRTALEEAIKDKDKNVQESSILALGMLQATKSSFLLSKMLQDKTVEHSLRAYSAMALGLMKDPANLSLLLQIAKDERKDEVRAAAVTALGLIGDERAVRPLLDIFCGQDEERIRALAVTSLGKLGVTEFKQNPKAKQSINLVRQFEKFLQSKETKVYIRQSLAMILGRFGDDKTIDVLINVVTSDRDKAVRSFALLSLAQIKKDDSRKTSVREFLRRILKTEKNVIVKSYAALAVGLSDDVEAAKILREIFDSGEDSDIRAAAAVGLGLLKDKESMPALGTEIEKPRGGGDVRRFACISLGLIGDLNASNYLKAVLEKVKEPYLRWSAAIGLARLGDKSCIDLLVQNLSDGSRVVKEAAVRAIGYFRDETQIKTLMDHFNKESNKEIQAMYIVSLGYIGDSAEEIPVLRQVSQDFNWLASLQFASIDFIVRVF